MAIRFKQPEKKSEVAVVVAQPISNARSRADDGQSGLEQVAHQSFDKRAWMRLYMREYRKRAKK
jgi:hypothetical protein